MAQLLVLMPLFSDLKDSLSDERIRMPKVVLQPLPQDITLPGRSTPLRKKPSELLCHRVRHRAQQPNVLFMMADDLSAKNSAFTKQR